MTAISIRPATGADTRFLAWTILTATRSHLSKGWFDIALNRPENECLDFLAGLTTTSVLSHWHYSRFLIAQSRGGPIAAMSVFRARDAYPVSTAALIENMRARGISTAEAALIWKRSAYMFKCTMRPDDDWWIIENLAMLPDFRGKGYMSGFLARAIEMGRAQGCSHAQVSVFIGNERAVRVYVKAGFHLAQERRDPHFEAIAGAPGLRQYTRRLQI